jgi:pimeloyl-ACP methyl ester carboxylesterase
MPTARANGIDIFYDTMGDPFDPTLLFVNGLGGQLIEWPDELCAKFVARALHVVRFDNRDVGLSTHLEGGADVFALLASMGSDAAPPVPYLLADMARDAVGLLEHLGIARAHVVGASMGGMIAQQMAISHPERVATLTSIMSTTGEPSVGLPTAEAMELLLAPPARTRDEAADHRIRHAHVWGSPGLFDEARIRSYSHALWDRDHDPRGPARQIAAILASGSRAEGLAALDIATLVIHGTADTLVQPSGGERTAELIPDAKLLLIEGMGHEIPVPLWDELVEAISAHASSHC